MRRSYRMRTKDATLRSNNDRFLQYSVDSSGVLSGYGVFPRLQVFAGVLGRVLLAIVLSAMRTVFYR